MKKMIYYWAFLPSFIGLPLTQNLHADLCEFDEPKPICENVCRGTFSIGADWLYWKSEEARLDYASAVTTREGDGTLDINAKVLRPKFKYDNGYRIFADYTTPDRLWKISAIYSHIPSHARNDFNSGSTMGMMSMTFISIFNVNFPVLSAISEVELESINSKWKSSINYFDLDLSRCFQVCDYLEITPHIGARGLWMDQSFNLRGTGEGLLFSSRLKGKLSSYGLEGGIIGTWKILERLYLIGNLGGSILYSNSHISGTLNGNIEGEFPQTIGISFRDKQHRGLPTFDAFIGLKYISCFSNHNFDIHVGWEHHIIFNTNQFSLAGSDNTTLQGLTVGGSIAF